MRTQLNGTNQAKNGQWSIKFISYAGKPGDEYVCSEVESAPVFATEDEAYAGGNRALNRLEFEGRYPNMCEPF